MKSAGFLHIFALILTTALPGLLAAQEPSDGVQLPEKSDVRIIVDISGSMKDTDPENLRQPAVRLLARLLPEGSTAGVWTFGQYVNMLVPHQEVTDAWREMAIQRSSEINSVALRTNLGAAIETASDDYVTDGDLSQTHFILLTDGKVDISDNPEANAAEEQRILDSIAARLIERGATFHPVALSEAADTDFLKALATRSGGRFQVAESADALNLAFLEALNAAVPQEQIPIEGDGFTVDSGVQEFTALIFWGESETAATRELALIRPDGKTLRLTEVPDNVRWAREAGYDLITVTGPQAGKWRIQGELGEGSRVTVVSDLRMVVSPLPTTFSAEQPLDIRVAFFEDQEKITNPDFLGVLEVSLTITSEDGRSGTKILSGDQPPEDGTYRDTVGALPAPGLYTIDVVADGKTFSRKYSATVGFTVPEGAEAPESAESVPASEPQAAPVSEQAKSEPEPAIEPPIDVSQVESAPAPADEPAVAPEAEPQPSAETDKAEPEPESEPEPEPGLPMWMVGAAGGAVVMLGGIVWFALRQRRKRQEAQAEAAAERETLADLDEDPEAVEAAVPQSEPEPEPEPEEIPEVTEPAADNDMADPDAMIEEPEPPKIEEEWPAEADDVAEEEADIPVADTPVDEESAEADDEEFGLEDFDLSEFDDLPDYDQEQSGLPDDDTDDKRNQKDSKK